MFILTAVESTSAPGAFTTPPPIFVHFNSRLSTIEFSTNEIPPPPRVKTNPNFSSYFPLKNDDYERLSLRKATMGYQQYRQ